MVERSEERERERVSDERVSISVEKIRKQCRKIPNQKASERDGVKDIGSRTSAVYLNLFPHK